MDAFLFLCPPLSLCLLTPRSSHKVKACHGHAACPKSTRRAYYQVSPRNCGQLGVCFGAGGLGSCRWRLSAKATWCCGPAVMEGAHRAINLAPVTTAPVHTLTVSKLGRDHRLMIARGEEQPNYRSARAGLRRRLLASSAMAISPTTISGADRGSGASVSRKL